LANCKKLANKRPTYEIEESIKLYKQELQKISEKMKAIIAERNLFENKAENKIKREEFWRKIENCHGILVPGGNKI
jgi:NADH:ubiquinone oxidoreductase subunit D